MFVKSLTDVVRGLNLYHVWAFQAYHDITAKYKRTFLGSFWLAGSTVVTSVSLAILFGALFHQSLQQSLPYVMSGMLAFGLAGYVFNEAPEIFMASAPIIRNHAYPFSYYVFHGVSKTFLMFLHSVVIFWIIMGLIGGFSVPNWSLIAALPIALLFMATWGCVAGMMAARFRDMRFMLPYVGQLLSFLTPIFWRANDLKPGALLTIVNLNPVYNLVQIVRRPLMGQVATSSEWGFAIGYTLLGLFVWMEIFGRFRRRIAFWV